MSRTKRIVFAAVAVALFFVLVEAVLWVAGVDTLLERRDPFQGFSRLVRVFEPDPDRGVRATPPRAFAHSFNYQQFALDKPEGAFRVFVLGGSSAFGFPWGADFAFPRIVGDALRASWPRREVEVVNAAAMSYGSHRLRILVHEVLEYDPDLIVVYSGHNEFVERRFYHDHLDRFASVDAARRTLYRSRTYSLMAQLYEGFAAGDPPDRPEGDADLLGLDVEREYATGVGDRERAEVQRLFEDNLRAIARAARAAGVPVMLCTVPSNVAGWVPNDSFFDERVDFDARSRATALVEEGKAALAANAVAAERALATAREIAPRYAETRFRLGEAYRALERFPEAREEFVAARDSDGKPSRAPTLLLDTIRTVARDEGVSQVDVERIFEDHAPGGLLGFNLFEDYVHPNRTGHRLIAWAVWSAIVEEGIGAAPATPEITTFEAVAGDPFGTPVEALVPADVAGTPSMLYNLAVVLENQGLEEQAIDKYARCLSLNPEYWLARENLALLLFQRGRYVESANEYAIVVGQRPDRAKALIGLGEALRRTGQPALALEALEQATRIAPDSAQAWASVGGTLTQLNRNAEAETAFRQALALAADDPESWVNLGLNLLFQKRLDEARGAFDQALRRRPHYPRARNGIAAVLTEEGELDEAERLFRENLALDPDDAFARGGLATIRERR